MIFSRMSLNLELKDRTRTIDLTAFTAQAEKILGVEAVALFDMEFEQRDKHLATTGAALRTSRCMLGS